MAVFRTLVRHRTVKAVFLSEAKILSSDFTFIVNIISRFVVCTLILLYYFPTISASGNLKKTRENNARNMAELNFLEAMLLPTEYVRPGQLS